MNLSIRQMIKIVEQQMELPFDDDEPDYANHWREILEYPDEDSSVPVEKQIEYALKASGATPVILPNKVTIYVNDDVVIELNGNNASITDKNEWIDNADVDEYFPDHENRFNQEFWDSPHVLYHATTEEYVDSILKQGLQADNRTRGLSNRGVGRAVFTTMNPEEAAYGSYGDHVFEIDMAQLPYHPYVGQEPAVVAYDLRGGLAHLLGADDYVPNEEGDMSPDTVIVYGNIPPQCLKLID